MHTLEPYHKWRLEYIASKDKNSPFYGRIYSEFEYSTKIYNYYIHPQWDDFGSETLYVKILYVGYEEGYAILEFIGEWNDCLNNDIMLLKQEVIDRLQEYHICKFILIAENVLNFHSSDDCYYEEWKEDIEEEEGWICFIGLQDHIVNEMEEVGIQHFVHFGDYLNWRTMKPEFFFEKIDELLG